MTEPLHPWCEFAADDAELAAVGAERLNAGPNFLGTVRRDRLPRVHPVSARVKGGRLALYMYASSPKGRDLREDGRYALHCLVADHEGGDGEFLVRGHGVLAATDDHTVTLSAAGFVERDGYVLYELGVSDVFSCVYTDEGPQVRRWKARS